MMPATRSFVRWLNLARWAVLGTVIAVTPTSIRAQDAVTNIPYAEAKAILDSLREDLLPAELRAKTSSERESAWPDWVSRRDALIRGRLARADEDSILNFLFFGSSFTSQPRLKSSTVASFDREPEIAALVQRRLNDLIAGIAAPVGNERLEFARTTIERAGITPSSIAGRDQTASYLHDIMTRVMSESQQYTAIVDSVSQSDAIVKFATNSTLFRDRGLSSDTSIFVNFGIEQALEAMKAQGAFGSTDVRRVAIIGPGLDFTDKQDGYDFYPPQTMQPFAVIDSLIRLGLARPDEVRLTMLDLSPRINQHFEAARERASAGRAYVVQLPRDVAERWKPGLVKYWEHFGDHIGTEVKAAVPPDSAGNVQVRAIGVRPTVVGSARCWDVDFVLQRLQPQQVSGLFDLIIATNVLVYYDVFEQSLALANVSKMLRPGGVFLSNNFVFEMPATPMNLVDFTDVVYSDLGNGDRFIWYQHR